MNASASSRRGSSRPRPATARLPVTNGRLQHLAKLTDPSGKQPCPCASAPVRLARASCERRRPKTRPLVEVRNRRHALPIEERQRVLIAFAGEVARERLLERILVRTNRAKQRQARPQFHVVGRAQNVSRALIRNGQKKLGASPEPCAQDRLARYVCASCPDKFASSPIQVDNRSSGSWSTNMTASCNLRLGRGQLSPIERQESVWYATASTLGKAFVK